MMWLNAETAQIIAGKNITKNNQEISSSKQLDQLLDSISQIIVSAAAMGNYSVSISDPRMMQAEVVKLIQSRGFFVKRTVQAKIGTTMDISWKPDPNKGKSLNLETIKRGLS